MKRSLIRLSVRAIALVLGLVVYSNAWANFTMTNPVTSETENYTWKFVGTDTWNGAGNWQNSSSANPSGTPAKSGDNTWDPILFDGNNININASISVEGWNLRMGLYNGANVTMNNLVKYQGGTTMWMTVDENSQLIIGGFGGGNITDGQAIKLSVAKANGITWSANLTSGNANNTFEYYLKGAGSVSYQAVSAANHKIKMADVTLTGTSQVSSKTLVSFTSTTKTFTADAAIKVYDGTTLKETVAVTSVRSSGAAIQNTTSELTTADAVGTCELVQCTDGIVLYYVDGDPSAVVAKTYTPSININFTSGTALSTAADVGLADYAVPGTSWNNLTVANNATLSSLNKIDSTGAATASPASVTITNTRGEWHCSSLAAASDLRAGYIDETADVPTPTVTVSGIPYDQYKVVVYTATDAANVAFGYVTINGTDYTYSDGAVAEGTTAWGASGAQNTAEALAEGVNVLVSPVVSGGTLTVVGHRSGTNPRGCIAAVQIVKVEQEVSENDLLIELDGDRTYTFDEAKAYSGTVYVTGEGTLTFDGAASTAATLHIGPAAAVNMTGSVLTPTAVTGNGTVVYDGAQPSTTLGFDNSANWQGTVWVKNVGDTTKGEAENAKVTTCLGSDTTDATSNDLNKWGNAASFVKFTNVRGYMATANVPWTLILEDDSSNYAWYNNQGWTARTITIAGLKGDGTFWDVNDGGTRPFLNFTDASQFTGAIHATGKQVFLGGAGTGNASDLSGGRITVPANQTVTVASGKTWYTRNGFVVDGALNVNGTLASYSTTAAVSGSGTVVFTGRAPTPTGDIWWKNANWTGTVQIASVNNMTGNDTGTKIAFNDYGNANSIVELNNVTGWLPNNYTCTPKLKITGTLSLNNGSSGKNNAFKVGTLLGSGTISGSSSAPTAVLNVTGDSSGFTGSIGLNDSKCIVFGSTIPDTLARGTIYISEGAIAEIKTTTGNWWATGGIVVNGTLKVTDRDRWGGGTAMSIGDNGVLELTSTANKEEYKDYSGVTGTGTIKYSSTAGWRLFPDTSARMPATTLTIQTELADSLIIACTSDTVIGNLAGSKNIRSDWGDNSANGRTLTVTQSKDTEWSGKFVSNRITQFNVNPGASTTGTLTLSGTQTISMPATISGSVNLTGTWVGDTTVSGTFGGTGTLTGNLTFNAGSTFKAFASDENGLAVSGTVAYPAEGTVTVDVSDLTLSSSGTTLITFTSAPSAEDIASKMVPSSGAVLKLDGSTLKAYPLVATYNGKNYATFKEAIDAALADEGGEANLALITVVDGSAELPGGYHISDNTVVKYPVAVVKNGSYLATGYTDTILQAIQAIYFADPATGAYDYIEIVSGSSFVIPYGLLGDGVLKIKNTANATPIPDGLADDCEVDTNEGEGYTEYSKVNKPTVYTWTGAAAEHRWGAKGNWSYVNNSSETVTASRVPAAGDSVVFTSAVSDLIIGADTSVVSVSIGDEVVISREFEDIALNTTEGGIVLTDAAATLTVTGVTLSSTPTTNVSRSRVKAVTEDGTTTYNVEVIPGTIFSVY